MKRAFNSLDSIPEAGEAGGTLGRAPKLMRAQSDLTTGNHLCSKVGCCRFMLVTSCFANFCSQDLRWERKLIARPESLSIHGVSEAKKGSI